MKTGHLIFANALLIIISKAQTSYSQPIPQISSFCQFGKLKGAASFKHKNYHLKKMPDEIEVIEKEVGAQSHILIATRASTRAIPIISL